MNRTHDGYLSFSEGKYRIIVQGMPVCTDTTLHHAMLIAKQFRVKLRELMWDGDQGLWVSMPEES